jgi:drug/metabolite transporter (DMT)-like permease
MMHYRASLFDKKVETNPRSHLSPPTATLSSRRGSSLTVDFGGNSGDIANHKVNLPSSIETIQAVPGRPRRRRIAGVRKRRSNSFSIARYKIQQLFMFGGVGNYLTSDVSLWLAIFLWYFLGVLSIASSKILLTGEGGIRVNPLSLTLQQLLIGASLLRCILRIRLFGSSGLRPWPPASIKEHNPNSENGIQTSLVSGHRDLVMSAVCFALGFLATNFAFAGSAASFVETVKAAEPLTSATVAAAYGIETITMKQAVSLGTIVAGVIISTVGGAGKNSSLVQTLPDTIRACAVVMTANLCFSFRGLYQKLFRKHQTSQTLDDFNLQFRMQWLGALLLLIPTLLFDIIPNLWYGTLLSRLAMLSASNERQLDGNNNTSTSQFVIRYCVLSLVNGTAFTCYNLASTWILSRISVVHHAALNCIRRVFAIILTSLYFGIPITITGAAGIALAVIGFLSYTYYKVTQQHVGVTPDRSRSKQTLSSLLPVNIQDNRE